MSSEKISFAGSVAVGFKKIVNFRGVAGRREYWFFVLFTILLGLVVGTLDQILFPVSTSAQDAFRAALEANPKNIDLNLLQAALDENLSGTPISNIVGFIYGLPLFTATVRRMRDAGFGAWWLLLSWVPLFTFIVTLMPSKPAKQL
jgi:uncharacterized membrane protein YhaH (DUF805 family)